MLLLVPGDPLRPGRPDDHIAPEAEAARTLGLTVRTVDHDALVGGDAGAAVRHVTEPDDDAVYRGWMLRSTHYAELAAALAARHVALRTSPHAYRRAHELPGWHDDFAHLTPESRWLEGPGVDGLDALLRGLPAGAAVVKDHVKSMKHHWAEAAFIPDVRDITQAVAIAQRFLELRGDDLVGGIVVRRFERFVGPEARTWWVNGTCRLVTAHPDTPHATPPAAVGIDAIADAVRNLNAPFVAVEPVVKPDRGASSRSATAR